MDSGRKQRVFKNLRGPFDGHTAVSCAFLLSLWDRARGARHATNRLVIALIDVPHCPVRAGVPDRARRSNHRPPQSRAGPVEAESSMSTADVDTPRGGDDRRPFVPPCDPSNNCSVAEKCHSRHMVVVRAGPNFLACPLLIVFLDVFCAGRAPGPPALTRRSTLPPWPIFGTRVPGLRSVGTSEWRPRSVGDSLPPPGGCGPAVLN